MSVTENFTGEVTARVLRSPDDESTLAMYEVTFAAGARTHWHAHPRGQLLLVTSGRARVHIDGRPVTEFGPGDSVWIPPGARHWHGAGRTGPMTHIAAQEASADGGTVTWYEPVPAATYDDRESATSKDDH